MKITEFVEVADLILTVEFENSTNAGPWITHLESWKSEFYVNYKHDTDDGFLTGLCGWGKTPDLSIHDLIRNLKEYKYAVVYSNKERSLVKLPSNLEYP